MIMIKAACVSHAFKGQSLTLVFLFNYTTINVVSMASKIYDYRNL